MAENEDLGDAKRRKFLIKATTAVGMAGAVAACLPFIDSMNPSADVLAKATTEVDLSGIPVGGVHTVAWQGKPIFIFHRTPEEIKAMEATNGIIDPEPDQKRVKQAEWLVVIGICTHMGCVPNKDAAGWLCPCHGSEYDDSGRVVRGPAPKNLYLPPYKFVAADKIVIGVA
ncbi:MAG TPA: ubiquinol-cytochrome c reductase iron-sulfur subunit [Gallionella sp.]|nr:ubiquinol-cytochrome c reductase iron-sulfur subunit [Gallionella sp.]